MRHLHHHHFGWKMRWWWLSVEAARKVLGWDEGRDDLMGEMGIATRMMVLPLGYPMQMRCFCEHWHERMMMTAKQEGGMDLKTQQMPEKGEHRFYPRLSVRTVQ